MELAHMVSITYHRNAVALVDFPHLCPGLGCAVRAFVGRAMGAGAEGASCVSGALVEHLGGYIFYDELAAWPPEGYDHLLRRIQ